MAVRRAPRLPAALTHVAPALALSQADKKGRRAVDDTGGSAGADAEPIDGGRRRQDHCVLRAQLVEAVNERGEGELRVGRRGRRDGDADELLYGKAKRGACRRAVDAVQPDLDVDGRVAACGLRRGEPELRERPPGPRTWGRSQSPKDRPARRGPAESVRRARERREVERASVVHKHGAQESTLWRYRLRLRLRLARGLRQALRLARSAALRLRR